MRHTLPLLCFSALFLIHTAAAAGPSEPACCLLPDNGGGTADIPANCPLGFQGLMEIVDGLPFGSTIQVSATLSTFAGLVQVPGGALGGNKETWTAQLTMQMTGTGAFSSYSHTLVLPISAGESHSAPRTPYAPVQWFNTDLYSLFGVTTTDPDFSFLRVTAGTGYGMPSPGQATLQATGPQWAADGFFDITYRIDFIGSPSGPFGGMSGSTVRYASRFSECGGQPTPTRRGTWGDLKLLYR